MSAEHVKQDKEDAELKILACIVAGSAPPNYEALRLSQAMVSPKYYSDEGRAAFLRRLSMLADLGSEITPSAVAEEGAVSDALVSRVFELSRTPHARIDRLEAHAGALRDTFLPDYLRRNLRHALEQIRAGAHPRVVIAEFEERVEIANSILEDAEVKPRVVADVARAALSKLRAHWDGEVTEPPFIPTQWEGLNRALGGGWYYAENVVAARPSVGKTIIWEQEAVWQGERGVGSIACSYEMDPEDHLVRMAKRRAGVDVDTHILWSDKCPPSVQQRFWEALEHIATLPILFACRPGDYELSVTLRNVDRALRDWPFEAPPKLWWVDYIQLLRNTDGRHASRREEIGYCNLRLKDFAVNRKLALVPMAQFNRDPVSDKAPRAPRMNDLKECGDIEQDAHNIIGIERDLSKYREGVPQRATAHVLKARNGIVGKQLPWEFIGERIMYRESEEGDSWSDESAHSTAAVAAIEIRAVDPDDLY